MHVSAINSVLIEKRAALQRLLDLYLSGEFHKDILIDKKSELEKAIGELERERASLLAMLGSSAINRPAMLVTSRGGRLAEYDGVDRLTVAQLRSDC